MDLILSNRVLLLGNVAIEEVRDGWQFRDDFA